MASQPPVLSGSPEEFGKLRWHCRRGMKELDVLLARYMDERFCNAPRAEQDAFRALLETQDPVLYAYCLGQLQPPAQFATLIEQLITSSRTARNLSLRPIV